MRNLLLLIFATLNLAGVAQQIDFISGNDGQTFFTCGSFIIDSGGQGGSGYGDNEDVTITICPGTPGDVITVSFNTFHLNLFDDNPAPGGNNYNVDEMLVYDGDNTSANFLGNYNGDGLQGAIIKATPQNPTGCITLRFISNSSNSIAPNLPNDVGPWLFTASATCTTPCADPFAGGQLLNGITADSIHVCIGEFINFQEIGSFAQMGFNLVSYTWDFMDGTTASGQNVSHAYTEAGYYRVQLFVTDDNGCTNNNLTDLDVKVATPPDFATFVKDTTICIGEMLSLKAEPLLYENTWTSINGSMEIEDGCMYDTLLGVAQDLDLTQTGFISGSTIANISDLESICLEIEHTFIGDLVVSIICPNGQSAILHQQGGGGCYLGEPVEDDGINCDDPTTYGIPYQYCFTPNATETWVDYVDNNNFPPVLPAGDYASVEPLNNLVGCPANGIWTLSVVDNWGADDGKVFSFSLNLNPDLYGDIVEFTPEHSTPSDSSYWHYPSTFGTFLSFDADSMVIVPTTPGVYSYPYTVVNDFGCANDTSVTITVFEVTLPFTLPDASECAGTPFFVGGDFQPCQFTLKLVDTYGDGWNGNTLDVTVGGVTTNYTVPDDPNNGFNDDTIFTTTITLNQGDVIDFHFDGLGSFLSECYYQLIDCNGNVIFQDGDPNDFMGPSTTPITYTVNLQGGEAGYAFLWSPASIMDDPTLPVPSATIDGVTTITMSYYPIDHPMCIVTDTMIASIVVDANAGLDNLVDLCDSLILYDLSTYLGPIFTPNGVWSDPNGNIVTMPIDVTTAPQGAYTYAVGNGTCFDNAVVTNLIRSEQRIQTHYVTDPHICIGDSSIFVDPSNLQGIQSIMVRFGDTSSIYDATQNYDSLFHYYPFVGSYDMVVDIVSVNGCEYHDLYPNIVSVHEYPVAAFTIQPEQVSMLDPNFVVTNITGGGITSFNWEFTSANIQTSTDTSQQITYPFEGGLYPITLYVEDSVGCRDSITKMVIVNEEPLIYFPNSFTPNDDEYNQDWKISAYGVALDQFTLVIYNRWGEPIFETHDPEVGWNGTFNNRMVEAGIYMWKLEAVDVVRNLKFTKEGHVNMLR